MSKGSSLLVLATTSEACGRDGGQWKSDDEGSRTRGILEHDTEYVAALSSQTRDKARTFRACTMLSATSAEMVEVAYGSR